MKTHGAVSPAPPPRRRWWSRVAALVAATLAPWVAAPATTLGPGAALPAAAATGGRCLGLQRRRQPAVDGSAGLLTR
ncbi:hypothetical protein ABZ330_05055 [Streptomyces sp. NPDC006172]|uniref:hypothetical protein n=1 Tax=Streptomyces sp. NPDC006172 TaxID=3154470 RepID=UPI0033E63094